MLFFFAGICGNTKPSNPTRKFPPPQRRRRIKACSGDSIGRLTSPRTSVLKPFFRITVENLLTQILARIIQAWYYFKSRAIIVSMAKETTGFRRDDAISAYNGGKLNFPLPTENLNFPPRMPMLKRRYG